MGHGTMRPSERFYFRSWCLSVPNHANWPSCGVQRSEAGGGLREGKGAADLLVL